MLRKIFLALMLPTLLLAKLDCSKYEYENCIRKADPLVKETRLIFPDNLNDIDTVCKIWDAFINCLKAYTEECFTYQQRRQFNVAVAGPIESVHQMCIQSSYQSEYLKYAPCIKNTILQEQHCGPMYNLMVEQVSQGNLISKSNLCCSYGKFKACVETETRKLCDSGLPNGSASRFAMQIIERALGFIYDQCANYISNLGDCNLIARDNVDDPLAVSTTSSEVYPWSTLRDNAAQKDIATRITPLSNSNTWFPDGMQDSSSTQTLGSRSRPASYGRASNWDDINKIRNTVQMQNPSSTIPTKPDLPSNAWNAQTKNSDATDTYSMSDAYLLESSSDSWYPAAGTQLNNEVDEPNQLGLRKLKNNASSLYDKLVFTIITLKLIYII